MSRFYMEREEAEMIERAQDGDRAETGYCAYEDEEREDSDARQAAADLEPEWKPYASFPEPGEPIYHLHRIVHELRALRREERAMVLRMAGELAR